eukprot:11204271-Lingulodinium_polyedra.AAC.1
MEVDASVGCVSGARPTGVAIATPSVHGVSTFRTSVAELVLAKEDLEGASIEIPVGFEERQRL